MKFHVAISYLDTDAVISCILLRRGPMTDFVSRFLKDWRYGVHQLLNNRSVFVNRRT